MIFININCFINHYIVSIPIGDKMNNLNDDSENMWVFFLIIFLLWCYWVKMPPKLHWHMCNDACLGNQHVHRGLVHLNRHPSNQSIGYLSDRENTLNLNYCTITQAGFQNYFHTSWYNLVWSNFNRWYLWNVDFSVRMGAWCDMPGIGCDCGCFELTWQVSVPWPNTADTPAVLASQGIRPPS